MAHENTSGSIPRIGSIQDPWLLPKASKDKRGVSFIINTDGSIRSYEGADILFSFDEVDVPAFFKNHDTGALYFVNDDRSVRQILPGDVMAASAAQEPVLTRDWPHGYEVGGWASDDMSWQDVRVLCWDRPGRAPVVVMTNDGTMLYLDENGSAPNLQLRCKPAPKRSGTVHVSVLSNVGDERLIVNCAFDHMDRMDRATVHWKTIARLEIPWIEGQGLDAET